MLPHYQSILDAGCGHGDFTIRMAQHAASIIGFDNSIEMIKIADATLEKSKLRNIKFVYATTKQNLPFSEGLAKYRDIHD